MDLKFWKFGGKVWKRPWVVFFFGGGVFPNFILLPVRYQTITSTHMSHIKFTDKCWNEFRIILDKVPIVCVDIKVMVRIDEHCFSMSMTLCKFMCKNYIIDLWDVFFFCGTNTTTLYQLVRIDWKGWLVYIIIYIVVVCRKDTVRDIMLQRMLICFMKLGNIAGDAWRTRRRSINDTERKTWICWNQKHKEHRKDDRKAYSQIEIACEVCKCTLRKCGWI